MKRGFIGFNVLTVFLITSLVLVSAVTTYYYSLKAKAIANANREINAFMNVEANNAVDICKETKTYTYYKDFNYNKKIKVVLNCKVIKNSEQNTTQIIFNYKACRKDFTGAYNICINKSGTIIKEGD